MIRCDVEGKVGGFREGWGVVCIYFFQAEDGIRDIGVTGVQTCALPILLKVKTTELLSSLLFIIIDRL